MSGSNGTARSSDPRHGGERSARLHEGERGVEAVRCGGDGTDLRLFLEGLESRGIRSVVCEGGGILSRALLDQGLLNEIHLLVLPVILDGGSVNLFEGPGMPVNLTLAGMERVWEAVVLTYKVT